MTYCFDIDGVVCTNTGGKYENARPIPQSVNRINALHAEGHIIYLYTARGATTGIDWGSITQMQLTAWGLKYHELFFGKPTADIYVDDKGMNVKEWLNG